MRTDRERRRDKVNGIQAILEHHILPSLVNQRTIWFVCTTLRLSTSASREKQRLVIPVSKCGRTPSPQKRWQGTLRGVAYHVWDPGYLSIPTQMLPCCRPRMRSISRFCLQFLQRGTFGVSMCRRGRYGGCSDFGPVLELRRFPGRTILSASSIRCG